MPWCAVYAEQPPKPKIPKLAFASLPTLRARLALNHCRNKTATTTIPKGNGEASELMANGGAKLAIPLLPFPGRLFLTEKGGLMGWRRTGEGGEGHCHFATLLRLRENSKQTEAGERQQKCFIKQPATGWLAGW